MPKLNKQVKIIATIGPKSNSLPMLIDLITRGVSVFRLNFSHGDHRTHGETIALIRSAAQSLGSEVAILADLQGPKIRTRKTENDAPLTLVTGAQVTITSANITCTTTTIAVDYNNLSNEIAVGQSVLINDGAIRLTVTEKHPSGDLCATVVAGGIFGSHKGVNFPEAPLSIPSLTAKDLGDLTFILDQDIQYIALSFVRKPADLENLKILIKKKRDDIRIIAKIEKPEAALRIAELLPLCDGIMVARGDLGVEASPSAVPILQKELIAQANLTGKLVIVATQMLESMIISPLPTRAESSDVANAVIDSADAIMLSGETAIGAYPGEAVSTMVTIAHAAEVSRFMHHEMVTETNHKKFPPQAICNAAAWAGRDLGGIPLCVYTISGETALYLSKIRYHNAPIFAFSPNLQVVRMLALAWNVTALYLPFAENIAQLHIDGEELLKEKSLAKNGDPIGIVSGTSPIHGATNTLRIKIIGKP